MMVVRTYELSHGSGGALKLHPTADMTTDVMGSTIMGHPYDDLPLLGHQLFTVLDDAKRTTQWAWLPQLPGLPASQAPAGERHHRIYWCKSKRPDKKAKVLSRRARPSDPGGCGQLDKELKEFI